MPRKQTRYLKTSKETIGGFPTAKMGRSAGHPEDAIKVVMFDPDEADRPYILTMPVSEARRFGAALMKIAADRSNNTDRCPYCANPGCVCDHHWGDSCRCEAGSASPAPVGR